MHAFCIHDALINHRSLLKPETATGARGQRGSTLSQQSKRQLKAQRFSVSVLRINLSGCSYMTAMISTCTYLCSTN